MHTGSNDTVSLCHPFPLNRDRSVGDSVLVLLYTVTKYARTDAPVSVNVGFIAPNLGGPVAATVRYLSRSSSEVQ